MSEEVKSEVKNIKKSEKTEKKRKKKLSRWFNCLRSLYVLGGWAVVRIKKLGRRKKFDDRAYLFVGNHRHVLDVVPPAISTSRPVHYMAKKELSEKGIGKWFTRKCECVLVNRDGNDVRAVMLAMKYLKGGESVCCFPEGTRNKTDEIFLPFKSGAATLAIKTKTPIVLVVQKQKMKLFKRNYFYFSEPFEFTEYYDKKLTEADILEADEKLKAKMLEIYMILDEATKDKKKLKALIKESKKNK